MLRAGATRARRGYQQPPPADQAARSTRSDKHEAVFAAAEMAFFQ